LVDAGDPAVLAYWREYQQERVLVLHNVADKTVGGIPCDQPSIDLLTGAAHSPGLLTLAPYQYLWLRQS
jgi:hypothetical protein